MTEPSTLVLGKIKGREFWDKFTSCGMFVMYSVIHKYEGDSKSKGKIHLTAVIQVTVSNFTYYFST